MNMAQQLRDKLGVNGKPSGLVDFNTTYGFNDTHLVIKHSRKIDNMTLTLKQFDDMIGAMQELRTMFIESQGKAK